MFETPSLCSSVAPVLTANNLVFRQSCARAQCTKTTSATAALESNSTTWRMGTNDICRWGLPSMHSMHQFLVDPSKFRMELELYGQVVSDFLWYNHWTWKTESILENVCFFGKCLCQAAWVQDAQSEGPRTAISPANTWARLIPAIAI